MKSFISKFILTQITGLLLLIIIDSIWPNMNSILFYSIAFIIGWILFDFFKWNFNVKHNIIDIQEPEPIIKEDTRITLGRAEANQTELFLFSEGYSIEQVRKEMLNYKII